MRFRNEGLPSESPVPRFSLRFLLLVITAVSLVLTFILRVDHWFVYVLILPFSVTCWWLDIDRDDATKMEWPVWKRLLSKTTLYVVATFCGAIAGAIVGAVTFVVYLSLASTPGPHNLGPSLA